MYTNPKQFGNEENTKKMRKYLATRMGFKPTFQEHLS